MDFIHVPVLLDEVLSSFDNNPEVFVDLTSGGGGHDAEILKKYPDVRAVLIDRDLDAVAHLKEKFTSFPNVTVVHSAFSDVDKILFLLKIPRVDIVFADLGVSSFQFDTPHRGFSMQKSGPMDMRMDATSQLTALDFIKNSTEGGLRNILSEYAQEREAGTVARTLKKCADDGMTTTLEFAEAIRKAKKYAKKGIDPSTQVFMALRMAVNDELGELERALKKSFPLLSEKGIMGIITFHSTEDRIVKNFFRDRKNNVPYYEDERENVPVDKKGKFETEMILPDAGECGRNPRARSAKLRILKTTAGYK
ncbi:16S rRNA (cytosine(1402)-N(4))-methyltransferase RsmH [bacterium]|nr:16S rRNA (cytosine(1402)-N(4))-methyltransferase RsmH [bacterium]